MATEADLVRDQLKRIEVSATFARVPRERELLRFLVECTLDGRQGEIKAGTIASDVLKYKLATRASADAKNQARALASHLRARLPVYYQNEGKTDVVLIIIPSKTYVPTFTDRSGEQQKKIDILPNSKTTESARGTRFWDVPPRNPYFGGRDFDMARVRDALAATPTDFYSPPLAISGLGGVGKTDLAIEYAHRSRDDYRATQWITASSIDSLLRGYASMARHLNLAEKDESDLTLIAHAVLHWMKLEPSWLVVLDNVENLAAFDRLLPTGNGHCLITTRSQSSFGMTRVLELDALNIEQGILLLLRRTHLIPKGGSLKDVSVETRVQAEQIVKDLGGLPLALDQAAVFIEETPSTLIEYCDLYRSDGLALRAMRGETARHTESVTRTFAMLFERLRNRNTKAAEIVQYCSFLDPDAIPEEVFTQGGLGSGVDFVIALRDAGRFSLLRRNPIARLIGMHRLVQEVVKDSLDQVTKRELNHRVAIALASVFPATSGTDQWISLDRYISHVKASQEAAAADSTWPISTLILFYRSALYLHDRADYSSARSLFETSVFLYQRHFGGDEQTVAMALRGLATTERRLGIAEEAEKHLLMAKAIYEKRDLAESDHMAFVFHDLAGLCVDQARYSDAEIFLQAELNISTKLYPPGDIKVIKPIQTLGTVATRLGHYEQAERLFQDAIALFSAVPGWRGELSGAACRRDMAHLYLQMSRYPEAEVFFKQSLEVFESVLGPDHPDVADIFRGLGRLFDVQGRSAEAEVMFGRAKQIYEMRLGEHHKHTVAMQRKIAMIARRRTVADA